jgi:arylsulfatase A-like enzyme/Tfp pilus assembly protein PilF
MRVRVVAGLSVAAIAVTALLLYRRTAAPTARHPNVLLISIDTLRADRLGSYGYGAAQTPALDGLAARGLRFSEAATVTPLTLPAHASLMTGTFPSYHGVRNNGGFRLADDQLTLAEVLRAHGYRTGGFVAAFVLDRRWGLDQGFDRYFDDFDLTTYPTDIGLEAVQRPGAQVVDRAIEWVDQDRGQPFFAWVHLYEPHAPYDAPATIRARFPPTTSGAYDAEIATADVQVARLLQHLDTGHRLDRTIVVAVGDHGESLGEHGELEHGFFVYEATLRIPLIMAGPGVPAGVAANQSQILDVMPTILDLAGVEVPKAVQGRSLVRDVRGTRVDVAALSETWYPRHHFGWSELVAIRDGRYKLIAAPRRELYDLEADPGETHDLAAINPARADALERALREKLSALSARKPSAPRAVDPDVEQRLRALGYVGASISPRHLEDRPRSDPKDRIGLFNLLKQAADDSAEGRTDDAIAKVRRALAEDHEMVEGYALLGNLQRKAGRADEAAAAFARVLVLNPHDTRAQGRLADVSMGRRDFAKAKAILEQMLADRVEPSAVLTRLGECEIELKQYDEAERHLLAALQEKPVPPAAHYDLGLVYEARREQQKAVAEYEAELASDPSAYRAHFNLAKLLAASGRREESARHFEQAVTANPAFASGYLYLAKARLDLGDLRGAESAALKGNSLGPDAAIAPLGHFVLADVYNRLGREQDAAREAAAGRRLEKRDD